MTYHLINEVVEHNRKQWLSFDAVADIYLFDIAGILLFNSERVQYFFSHKVIVRDWSPQASYVVSDNSIQNVGQYFSIKWNPTFKDQPFSLFWYMGLGALFGIGYNHNDFGYSVGGGFKTKSVYIANGETNQEGIKVSPAFGIFIDKKNSLLGSLTYNSDKSSVENFKLDIFPGTLPFKKIKVGFWISKSYNFSSYLGITVSNLPGLGIKTK